MRANVGDKFFRADLILARMLRVVVRVFFSVNLDLSTRRENKINYVKTGKLLIE